ncbi:MAG: DNA polymerase III subunit chi [Cypionkella sp.]|nr:DNA polymerase III subunit chi [Cypionkella sp.]
MKSAPAQGVVVFYHLTQSPASSTLKAILPRALQAGWRVLLRGEDAVLQDLDAKLWDTPAAFLPHGLSGGAQDDDQPILLGNIPSAGFDALALVGSIALDIKEAANLHRVWVLFDAADDAQMTAARRLWKEVSGAGLHAQYHSEETGKWALKTAVNAPAKA